MCLFQKLIIKKYIKRYLFGLLATTPFQPLFRGLYRLSLWSMNIGLGGGVEDSGEKYILTKFAKSIDSKNIPVVFDVGANKGQFAQTASKILGTRVKMHCFEPSLITFPSLEKNLDGYSNIQLHNFGLGEFSEEVTLYADDELSGCASLYYRKSFGLIKVTETVKLKALDDFCLENGIQHIHYLKLDVEGHELSVIKGAKNMLSAGRIDLIQFEFGGCNIDSRTYFRDFFDLLNPLYSIYRLLRNGLAPIKEYHETLEVFTTTNFIAISRTL
ncbi:FkbM family methyltransferase [Scytonema sp. PCC 10023]|uniref:FkbM family methyltransferase n=1 Tax=Scytonema sp. PCC 10023 TaxID=1680591 RepID=UPI0039C6296F